MTNIEENSQKGSLFNVWFDTDISKTTIIARDETEALSVFYKSRGLGDYVDYCQYIYCKGGEHANVELVR